MAVWSRTFVYNRHCKKCPQSLERGKIPYLFLLLGTLWLYTVCLHLTEGKKYKYIMAIEQREIKFIQDNIGSMSLELIAKKLGKEVNAVQKNLYKYTGSTNTRQHTGMVTAGELAKAFKVDRNTVVGWIERHDLSCMKKITNRQRRFTFIDIEVFWKWAEMNKERIDFSKLGRHALPPEPIWVVQERSKIPKKANYKAWTVQEEKRLIALVEEGKDFKEITKILDRSSSTAVEKKYYRLTSGRTIN